MAVKKFETQSSIKALMDPRVQQELELSIPGFDRTGFLTALLEVWGGQDKLALSVYQEFYAAAKGSMVRQRILELISRLIAQHSDSEKSVPVEELDDEALRASITHFAGMLQEKVGVKDGQAPVAEEA